jgi:hypothetical protein
VIFNNQLHFNPKNKNIQSHDAACLYSFINSQRYGVAGVIARRPAKDGTHIGGEMAFSRFLSSIP